MKEYCVDDYIKYLIATTTDDGTGSVFKVESGTTLTIKDTSEGKTGKITGRNAVTKTNEILDADNKSDEEN